MKIEPKEIKQFLLIYNLDDYPENGGGVHYESFDSIEEVEEWLNDEGDYGGLISVHALVRIDKIMEVTKLE